MFSYSLSTDVGKIRLLIPDRNADNSIFQDEELDTFLVLEGDVRLAAACALETIASDQVMVLKVMKLLDLSTDGSKVSQALLERAKKLRDQVELDSDPFAIVEMVTGSFSAREHLWNEVNRDSPP